MCLLLLLIIGALNFTHWNLCFCLIWSILGKFNPPKMLKTGTVFPLKIKLSNFFVDWMIAYLNTYKSILFTRSKKNLGFYV